MNARVRINWLAGATLLTGLALAPDLATAQTGAGDGYLFHSPQATLSLRMGMSRPSANSRVFDFTSEQLTVDRNDFLGFSAAADLNVSITRRLAFQMGTAVSARQTQSEYRDYVDNDDLPIEQRTTFRRAPVTAGLKFALTNPGRSLGRYAWVPSKVTPYVAGGAGLMYYSFKQDGDFVDYQDFAVFNSTLSSSGWTNMAYGAVGVDYSMSARMGLITEARYERARANMGTDFQGFDRIDLSGLQVTAGLHLRF